MKKLKTSLYLMFAVASVAAKAEESAIELNCYLSNRARTGTLRVQSKPIEGYLSYDLHKSDHFVEDQNYEISGSNQEALNQSALSWSSVSFSKTAEGLHKIKAQGESYDRASLIGKTDIEVTFKTTDFPAPWGYSLISLKVNGIEHTLGGGNHCSFP